MNAELLKIKYVNPLTKVRQHEYRCDNLGCVCIERKYRSDYNFKLENKTFEFLKTNSKKYSLLCKVGDDVYYCYNINEMLDSGFEPINIQFKDKCFLWEVEGMEGKYKSKTYFKLINNISAK